MNFRYIFNINNIFLFIPFLLITGGFLPGVAIVLILISSLFNSKLNKEKLIKFLSKKINIFIILILFYLVIQSLLTNYKYESISSTLLFFRYYLFVIVVFYCINFNETFYKYFFYLLSLIFLLFFIDSIIQFNFKKNIFFFPIEQPGRVSSFFKDELMLGSYIARFLPILIGLIFMQNMTRKSETLVISFFLFISLLLIILSGERNAIILFLLTTFLIILLIKETRKLFIFLLFFSIIIFLIFYFLNNDFKNRMFEFYNLLADSNSVIYETYSQILFSSIQIIKENFLFGVGPGLYELHCKEIFASPYYCRNHTHNIYLQFFTESGIIGFSFIFGVFLYFSKEIINHLFNNSHKSSSSNIQKLVICMLISVYINIWPLSQHTDFFSNYISNIHFFILSIYIKVNHLYKSSNL